MDRLERADGDRDGAFLSVVEANLDRLYSSAYRFTRSREEAEDLVQETLLRAWGRFEPHRAERELLAYLYRIMVNLVRDRRRRGRVLELRPTDPVELHDGPTAAGADLDALRRLTAAEVRRAIDSLPERYRLPVLLVDVDGFTYEEVSVQLGVPVGTVTSRLRRGRLVLRRLLWRAAASDGIASDEVCREAGPLLAAYRRGEASEADRRFVEAHLERCLPCRDGEAVDREVVRLVRERACRLAAPAALVAFVRGLPARRALGGGVTSQAS